MGHLQIECGSFYGFFLIAGKFGEAIDENIGDAESINSHLQLFGQVRGAMARLDARRPRN